MAYGALAKTCTLKGVLSQEDSLKGKLTTVGNVQGKLSLPTTESVPVYSGDYIATPSSESQVLETAGFQMIRNVVVNPIPQNYGLITWDGSVLTVS